MDLFEVWLWQTMRSSYGALELLLKLVASRAAMAVSGEGAELHDNLGGLGLVSSGTGVEGARGGGLGRGRGEREHAGEWRGRGV